MYLSWDLGRKAPNEGLRERKQMVKWENREVRAGVEQVAQQLWRELLFSTSHFQMGKQSHRV